MPNLKQLRFLHEKYGTEKPDLLEQINSYLDNNCAEELLSHSQLLNESQRNDLLMEFLVNRIMKKGVKTDFDKNVERDVFLLFIDISGFSELSADFTSLQIRNYLNRYYAKVIPIIHSYGGEIEKTIGDGLIVVFGKPFINTTIEDEFNKALTCSKKIIKKLIDTEWPVKIAMHYGEVKYYKNPLIEYEEYTMFGKALTELFRLESISEDNKINFYSGSTIDDSMNARITKANRIKKFTQYHFPWIVSKSLIIDPPLRGVGFDHYRTIELNRV